MYKIKLTPYAKIFYTEWLLTPDSSRYNLSIDQTLYGNLDIPRLKRALKRYISEHLILNSHIQSVDGEPYWVTNNYINELEYSNCSIINTSELLNYVNRSFDLHNEPLYRFRLLRLADDIYRFTVVMHHLVMDGSSSLDPGVFEAISSYYNDENYTIKPNLSEQANLITNLTNTLSIRLEQNEIQYKEFWDKQLSDVESIDLKFLKWNKNNNNKNTITTDILNSIEVVKFNYGDIESAKLAQIRHLYSITPYAYSQCILALLLHRYTDQEKLAISYPIAIKDGIDFIYGAQINTNLIPYQFNDNTAIVDLFEQSLNFSKLTLRDDIKCGYHPISDIIQGSDKHLLDICFNQTFFRDKPFGFVGINTVEIADLLNLNRVTSDMILFEQNPRNNGLHYRVVYDKNTFDKDLVGNFVTTYQKLFLEVLEDLLAKKSHKRLSAYSLLNAQQYHQIVYEFNRTEKDYPQNKIIHALFEEQVLKTPNNIAVIYEDTKLTYQKLNQKSNQLANYLLSLHKIRADDLITLCLDRNEHMLVAIFGALKSGGAYVPIDPKFPDERISYILSDTKTNIILTNSSYQARLQQIIQQGSEKSTKNISTSKPIVIDLDDVEILGSLLQQKNNNPITATTSNNLVYVLYTSGTTGQPKGVMLEHIGCVNRILEMINVSQMTGKERVLFKTNYIFDVSFSDIFTTLLTGASLIVTKNVFDIDEIASNFSNYLIDICHFTPSQFEVVNSIKDPRLFKKTKILNFSGEALYPKLLGGIDKNILCANYYGPTETGEVTFENTKLTEFNKNISTIGKPLHNIKLFILDKYMKPLPIGAIGELYISGICLARGYLNNLQLTNSKFIVNPFQTAEEKSLEINNRLYKTGDLVRWLPNGNIEYIGRNDSQIKIRGHRVELSEIENQLLKFDQIKQVALIVNRHDDGEYSIGDQYLVAYYVADTKLDEKILYDYLALHLPEYMLPSALVHISKLPLTPNGKLDKAALPKIQFEQKYTAPTCILQDTIVSIWSKILQLPKDKIGIKDSFFRLGGTSISIIKLQYELSQLPELKNIKLVDLFKYVTVEQLTEFVAPTAADKIIEYSIPKKTNIDFNVAIIAVSGAFSGCNDISEYWDLIQYGKEGLKSTTTEELRQNGTPEEILRNPNFVPRSGHVSHTDKFDPNFWGITPNEAKNMDPQIRKFLEHCWYVLETSGYTTIRRLIKIGVFAGGGDSVYVPTFTRQPLIVSGIGNLNIKDALATRVSYFLGLIGPANNINTACSTSLVAVVEACKNLVGNYCDMAIAGGSALLLPEEAGYIYQEGMIFSPDGYCRTFDQQAAGTVHGSGVGVALLKRLSDAKKDGDNVLAVIKGYATNNDGNRKISYTAPSIAGQKECIVGAQRMAEVTSDMVNYIECHGTGTKLGDPIEIRALKEAFEYNANKNNKQQRQCILGAVKANIGHAGAAAGVAGLIKVCQMLQHRFIPEQINYETPNEELNLNDTNFEIMKESKKWEVVDNSLRIAGISSFGIGGTNAHIIVSEYVPENEVSNASIHSANQKSTDNHILPLSAKSNSSLKAYKQVLIDFLAKTTDKIEDIAYTLQTKREYFDHRFAIVCNSIQSAIEELKATTNINSVSNQKQHNVIFMFPGQGNQYPDMSLGLYQNSSKYRNIIDECIALANRYADIPVEKVLFPTLFASNVCNASINNTTWAQLTLFIVEYSLAKLLGALNINATSYIGHSIGEYVAATLSGVFSLEDAIKLVIMRGQLMQSMPQGAMLSIQADVTEIEKIIRSNNCELAVINSPKNCVASGTYTSINNLKARLDQHNIPTKLLRVSHAYHSYSMMEASREFVSRFDQIKLNKPQKRFISNITGNFITDGDAINPEYWANHLRKPVLFTNGIKTLFEQYSNLFFVEVGPGKSSISFVKQHDVITANVTQLLNSQKDKDNDVFIKDLNCEEAVLSRLWMGGYNFNFDTCYKHRKTVVLPNYCFDSASYWVTPSSLPRDVDVTSTADSSDIVTKGIKNRVIEQNLPDRHYAIAKIFLDILGVKNISVYDDFFTLGADSLLAVSLTAQLQRVCKIGVGDIFKFRTIAKIAESVPFIKEHLYQQLKQIKLIHSQKKAFFANSTVPMLVKEKDYLDKIKHFEFVAQRKILSNVLLTGSTGHVGCNILYQLLHETFYKIYLLIRASSYEEALEKINHKCKYYFDSNLDGYKSRITILVADIEKPDLGLTMEHYQELVNNVDSIIHAAAIVKQYGSYTNMYKANVQTTINLLELSKRTKNKDFHYISTIGVLVDGYIPKHNYYVFTEEDDARIILDRKSEYSMTKYEGELIVNKYREYGVVANIYRLGNVAMHSTSYRHQENIEENGFFNQYKIMLNLGMIYEGTSIVEISPVDYTALAIVKLFDQACLNSQVYHVFNPRLCDLTKLFTTGNMTMRLCSLDKFIDEILEKPDTYNTDNKGLELIMLQYQKYLGDTNHDITHVKLRQDKTEAILSKLGFYWSEVTKAMCSDIMKRSLN